MELLLILLGLIVLWAAAKTMFADKKTKTLRRIWTATCITNSASYDERRKAFDMLFEIYGIDFENPPTLAAEKICGLAKDAANFDAKYPNNRGVFLLAEVGNELKARAKRSGEEAAESVESGMIVFGGLVSANIETVKDRHNNSGFVDPAFTALVEKWDNLVGDQEIDFTDELHPIHSRYSRDSNDGSQFTDKVRIVIAAVLYDERNRKSNSTPALDVYAQLVVSSIHEHNSEAAKFAEDVFVKAAGLAKAHYRTSHTLTGGPEGDDTNFIEENLKLAMEN